MLVSDEQLAHFLDYLRTPGYRVVVGHEDLMNVWSILCLEKGDPMDYGIVYVTTKSIYTENPSEPLPKVYLVRQEGDGTDAEKIKSKLNSLCAKPTSPEDKILREQNHLPTLRFLGEDGPGQMFFHYQRKKCLNEIHCESWAIDGFS